MTDEQFDGGDAPGIRFRVAKIDPETGHLYFEDAPAYGTSPAQLATDEQRLENAKREAELRRAFPPYVLQDDGTIRPLELSDVPTFTPSRGQFVPQTFEELRRATDKRDPRTAALARWMFLDLLRHVAPPIMDTRSRPWFRLEPPASPPSERDTQVHNAIAAMKKAERGR